MRFPPVFCCCSSNRAPQGNNIELEFQEEIYQRAGSDDELDIKNKDIYPKGYNKSEISEIFRNFTITILEPGAGKASQIVFKMPGSASMSLSIELCNFPKSERGQRHALFSKHRVCKLNCVTAFGTLRFFREE
jgi:hypothetical protein